MSFDSCARNSFILIFFLLLLGFCRVNGESKVFNLIKYGGYPSKTVDNSKALLRAWNDACKWKGNGQAVVVIPKGDFLVNEININGPCSSPIRFRNQGILWAPPRATNQHYWIRISDVDSLTIYGGIYDGQGQEVWKDPESLSVSHAHLSMYQVTNSVVQGVTLKDSKKVHLYLTACHNVEIKSVATSTPETGRNTDSIKLSGSTAINIHDTSLASGDDCVAILKGTRNVNVTRVFCGPGHGFSIGSMGGTPDEVVSQIRVHNCTVNGASNGVRIKTKPTNNPGSVSNVRFDDIIMNDVPNPIIIDQKYGTKGLSQGESHVQIDGVIYNKIRGTSAGQVAIDLSCSKSNPCKNIRMSNINLSYAKSGEETTSSCSNIEVDVSGEVKPILPCSS